MSRIAHCPHCELVYKLRDDAPEEEEVICEHCRQPFTLRLEPRRTTSKPGATTGSRHWREFLIGIMRRPTVIIAGIMGALLLYLAIVNRQLEQDRRMARQQAEAAKISAWQATQQPAHVEHRPAKDHPQHPPGAAQLAPDPPHPKEDGVFHVVVDASTQSPAALPVRLMQDRGWSVSSVRLPRATPATLERFRETLHRADLLIRAVGGGHRKLPSPVITAFQDAVRNGSVLVLLGRHPTTEGLAEAFGLNFGLYVGRSPLDSMQVNDVTSRFDGLHGNWSIVTRMPIEAVELAWVKPRDHAKMPVLGYLPYGEGLVLFCGADQRLTEPLQQYLLSLATAVSIQGERIKISQSRIRQLQSDEPAQTSPPPVVPGSGMGRRNQRPERPPGPKLLSPAAGATLPQPGRHRWEFDWDDVQNAAEYHLILVRPEDRGSVIRLTSGQSHLSVEPGTLDLDEGRRSGWTWYVRAIDENGNRSNWSERRPFEISDGPEVAHPQTRSLNWPESSRSGPSRPVSSRT